jgi:hypothetical protein
MSLRSRRSTRLRHVSYPGSQGAMLVSLKTSTTSKPIESFLAAGMPIAIACPLVRYATSRSPRHVSLWPSFTVGGIRSARKLI